VEQTLLLNLVERLTVPLVEGIVPTNGSRNLTAHGSATEGDGASHGEHLLYPLLYFSDTPNETQDGRGVFESLLR